MVEPLCTLFIDPAKYHCIIHYIYYYRPCKISPIMNTTTNNTPAPVIIPGLDWLFRWLDRHPRTAAALLWLQAAALAYVVFTYDFTTRI